MQATHATLSTNEHINFWLQFTAHPIMFNVFVWIPQHLISHHQYTNDPNMDVDVHHFAPALLSSEQPPFTNNRHGPLIVKSCWFEVLVLIVHIVG